MVDLKELCRTFHEHLFACIQGSVMLYQGVVREQPEEWRQKAWEEYNTAFEQKILPALLEALQGRGCTVHEVCHAALKLVENAARIVQAVERQNEEGPLKAWFFKAPEGRTQ